MVFFKNLDLLPSFQVHLFYVLHDLLLEEHYDFLRVAHSILVNTWDLTVDFSAVEAGV